MFCARLSLFKKHTALADSKVCAGMPPGMGVWMKLGSFIVVGNLGADAGVVATSNIVAICLIAVIYSVPREGKGDDETRLSRETVNSRASVASASVDEVSGMDFSCGKSSTVREILLKRVLGM